MNLIERLISFMKMKSFTFTLKPSAQSGWIFHVDGIRFLDIVEPLIGEGDIYGMSEDLIRTGTPGRTLSGFWFFPQIN